jgi:serine/threonine protein kinase
MTAPLTAEGTIVGTLQYMAPEQLEGKEADARTDLWALGAILYEMVTGKRAFEGESQMSLAGKIMNAEPVALASLQPLTPPALERVVKKCLAKAPDLRWDSAHDVADELRWIREDREWLAAPRPAWPLSAWPSRGSWRDARRGVPRRPWRSPRATGFSSPTCRTTRATRCSITR